MDAIDRPQAPVRHPSAPAPESLLPCHFHLCYGCGERPYGLRMQLFAGEDVSVRGRFVVGDSHQGAPGLAHGGLLAASMDELLGSLNWMLMAPAVTASLKVDFRRPVPVDTTLELRARVVGVSGRKVSTQGEARFPDGGIAFTGTGLFVQVNREHFSAHGRPEDVLAAASERAGKAPSADQPWLEVNP